MMSVWKTEDGLLEFVLSYIGSQRSSSGCQTWVKCPYLQSHLVGPQNQQNISNLFLILLEKNSAAINVSFQSVKFLLF